jgi:transposase-like protein
MTRQADATALDQIVELVTNHGSEAMAEAFASLLEIGMKLEREQVLGAQLHERTEARCGYANGYKPKTLDTRAGRVIVQVPKARGLEFYPASLQKGIRSERALKVAIAEMYVKGISTRKVAAVMEQLCGLDVSSTQVSRAAAELDGELEAWRTRPIEAMTYLILDARYEKVRHGGSVVSCAMLTAIGIAPDGRRTILGTSCELSEAEVHWRSFLQSLVDRGLRGVQLIVSDAHEGLKEARTAVFTGVRWQRCQFHLAQNAMAYVPKMSQRKAVGAELRTIFNAADREEAERRLRLMAERYTKTAPKLTRWIEDNIPEGLTVFDLPLTHRRRLRTTNGLERINQEIKRRTRVATLFPNEASILRLVSAVLVEIDEEWSTGRRYLDMEAE